MLFVFDVLIRPDVFEGSALGWGADGGFVSLLGVEGWVEVYQIDAIGVDAAQDVEVVGYEKRSIFDVY